jgi:hypothetical protein
MSSVGHYAIYATIRMRRAFRGLVIYLTQLDIIDSQTGMLKTCILIGNNGHFLVADDAGRSVRHTSNPAHRCSTYGLCGDCVSHPPGICNGVISLGNPTDGGRDSGMNTITFRDDSDYRSGLKAIIDSGGKRK